MPSSFVRPETVTLSLSEGRTITIRRVLTAGERNDMMARGWNHVTQDYDRILAMPATVAFYLLDWNFRDVDGKPVDIRDKSTAEIETIIKNLDPDVFDEIHDAINKNYAAVAAERVKEKNVQGGESLSSVTSPSLDSSVGRTPTSVN